MDPARVDRLRKRLLEARDELLSEGDLAIEPGRADPSRSGVDDDEQPLVEMSQSIASNRNRDRTRRLRAVETALRRLEAEPDVFGQCRECEDEIGEKRLTLMPWVQLCIECQDAREEDRPYGRRHAGDYR